MRTQPRSDAVLVQRARIQRWSLWECDERTLEKMQAEVQQEMDKVALQIDALNREFDKYIQAGDPLTVEELRVQARALGQKWDSLNTRGREIDTVMRQKLLDRRMIVIGRRFGIAHLVDLLRNVRILLLGTSLVAVLLSLLPNMDAPTLNALDMVNFICSLALSSEFAFRLMLVTGRSIYLRHRALDIFLALPLVTLAAPFPDLNLIARALTLLRAGRLVRLIVGERRDGIAGLRQLRAPEFRLLQRVLVTALFLVALGAAALRTIEGQANGQLFSNFNENLWWGIKIILTANVDANPATWLGKLVTIGIIILGISITSILIATITAVLINLTSDTDDLERQQDTMNEQLEGLRTQLDLLTDARQRAALSASRVQSALVNAEADEGELMHVVMHAIVQDFGCLQASLHLIDEAARELELIAHAGNPSYTPERRLPFDEGLLGRALGVARRGEVDVVTGAITFESEPLPLADGEALAIPLFVRHQWRGSRRIHAEGVLHVVVPKDWLHDVLLRVLLIDLATAVAQFLHSREASMRHESLLASISDLQNTMERVTTTLEYDRLLFVIAEGANALLDADMSKVMLMNPDQNSLSGTAWHGMDVELGRALYSRLGEGLSGICARTGNPIKSSNLLTDQRVTASSSQALRSGMRSELCVPIRARGVVLGVLSVMSKEHKRFTAEEEALLSTLAGQAGAAIENAEIYGVVQSQLRIAEAMQDVAQKLSESTDERETLNWILTQVKSTIHHRSASILLVEGDRLQLAVSEGFEPGELPESLSFPLAEHRLFERIAHARQPLIVNNTELEPGWLHSGAHSERIKSWIGAPIIVEGFVIGLLSIDGDKPDAFNETDAKVSFRFAVQAALAVRTARLYHAVINGQDSRAQSC